MESESQESGKQSPTAHAVPVKHGVPATYNAGCRCLDCREKHDIRVRASEASARYRRKKYAERRYVDGRLTHPNPGHVGHGSISAYTSYGCRCVECGDAMRQHQSKTRHTSPAYRRERWMKNPDERRVPVDDQPVVDTTRVFEW